MDPITILLSIATLVKNPALGGGGIGAEATSRMLLHLVQLIQGGRKTAQALEAWGLEIKAMADSGTNPTERDFDRWTGRLDTALAVIAEAKAALEEGGMSGERADTQLQKAVEEAKKDSPVESAALAALDEAAVHVAETEGAPEPEFHEPSTDPEPAPKRGRRR